MALMNPEATRKAETQARLARFAETPFDANVDYLAFGAFSFDVARALFAGSHKESLILDSGATDHIFTEREHFVEYTPTLSTQRAFITIADGSSHKVAGTGFVHIRVRNGSSFFQQPLNSIHVPTFACTLVSTSCLVKRGGLSFLQLPTGPELKKGDVKWADVVEQPSGLTLLAATIIMPGSHNTTANLFTGMI